MISHEHPISIYWHDCSKSEQNTLLTRPINNKLNDIYIDVKNILTKVYNEGDRALFKFNFDFDNVQIKQLQIPTEIIMNSGRNLSNEIKQAIHTAMTNITRFHQAQCYSEVIVETFPGVYCQQIIRPLNIVGLYVPGGTAPLLSTVMMLGIPARIAKCKRVILCSPPPIPDIIIYTAQLCGIDEIYQVGGSQAIAAMGFGTESIPKVDKIFGPGNIWVTEAKRQINLTPNGAAIDMLAGPSEILIIADNTANPIFIAADLLSQSEHGPDSHIILITPYAHLAEQTKQELHKQLKILPRNDIIQNVLLNSRMIITNNLMECFSISNSYAPEHLIIQIENASDYLHYIINAGSIFLGNWSPETAGDYASGPNHVLPTYGRAVTTSGLGVTDFQKRMSVQQLTQNGLLQLSSTITTLTQIEQLKAHEYAITHRINYIKEQNERSLLG
ncbi:histidinol dehydrogenase [Blochmannia endosymbiont of Camponotus sp.]|uniref:histidinol dehydrogenase n=1 Tax=Blochmannia endosymbiont of Camponotus sp. TaxID=700220 RepID=UPI0020249410|nr:histidinol dehydrogenase [Blochmannia endosymbiont of Camponotus sp.]URJ32442.1 histidinol dehydrogenase [Blochmannia endosymbiont of Camponotus sp.]